MVISKLPGCGGKPQISISEQAGGKNTIVFSDVDFTKTIAVSVTFYDNNSCAYSKFITFENGEIIIDKESRSSSDLLSYLTCEANKDAGTITITTIRSGKFLTSWLAEVS